MIRSSWIVGGVVVLSIAALTGGCSADAPPEQQGETTNFILSGRVLTPSEVAGDLRSAGFPENLIGKMTCVAKYESSFFERAQNGSFYGLYQIGKFHVGKVSGCPSTLDELFDAAKNARCAKGVFDAQGINAWQAYSKHKSECDAASAPAGSPTSTGSAKTPPSPSRPSTSTGGGANLDGGGGDFGGGGDDFGGGGDDFGGGDGDDDDFGGGGDVTARDDDGNSDFGGGGGDFGGAASHSGGDDDDDGNVTTPRPGSCSTGVCSI